METGFSITLLIPWIITGGFLIIVVLILGKLMGYFKKQDKILDTLEEIQTEIKNLKK